MAETAHGYPYPVGSDRVMDGDNAIEALAAKIETNLSGGTFAAGVSLPSIPSMGTSSAVVTFPVGMFTVPPFFTTGIASGSPHLFFVGYQSGTAVSVTIYISNRHTAATPLNASVIAHQQA